MKLILIALCCGAVASATTFTYNATVTLNPAGMFPVGGSLVQLNQSTPGTPVITVQNGDTVTGTISFTNPPVGIVSSSSFLVGAFFNPIPIGPSMNATTNASLVGVNAAPGTTIPTPLGPGTTGGCCIFVFESGGTPPYNFTFTGINYTFTFTSLSVASAQFSLNEVRMQAGSLVIGSSVPEPATVLQSAVGLMLVFLALRRRART